MGLIPRMGCGTHWSLKPGVTGEWVSLRSPIDLWATEVEQPTRCWRSIPFDLLKGPGTRGPELMIIITLYS